MVRHTFRVTYGQFLAACRRLAGFDNKSEFARHLKLKRVNHYIGVEGGKRKPGRELLEAAARSAGFEFEECIALPVKDAISDESAETINQFRRLLLDPKHEAAAKYAVIQLMSVAATSEKSAVRRGRKPKR